MMEDIRRKLLSICCRPSTDNWTDKADDQSQYDWLMYFYEGALQH